MHSHVQNNGYHSLTSLPSGVGRCSYKESVLYAVGPQKQPMNCSGPLSAVSPPPPINIQPIFCIPGFRIYSQPTMERKQYLRPAAGNRWVQRAACTHRSTPFYIRDVSILRFWYPQPSWNQSPRDDYNYVLGESKGM